MFSIKLPWEADGRRRGMKQEDCVSFLKWCLPRLGMSWPGFRKVRKTVCKRVAGRLRSLGLADVDAYRRYLEAHEEEWPRLDAMCRIPISRFWRDGEVFGHIASVVLPALAEAAMERGDTHVRVWSAGSASGEEPYSLRLAWSDRAEAAFPSLSVRILATDIDEMMLSRAAAGIYGRGSIREVPPDLVGRAFRRSDDLYEIREEFRRDVTFLRQDIRREMPEELFDLILCRNLVFTYFDEATQADLLERICQRLRPGGALVIGRRETLPDTGHPLVRWGGPRAIHRLSSS
ncbi:CheR family methyltransferase [Ostreiculturibacter nitratireducens]|uniref:CheR family methyltransferase n=1 Tax=Ostreiculturibacter nitratireducens TaxID=3075226 RepID=UPI0031B59692